MATTPFDLSAAARLLAEATDGGELFLPADLSAASLEQLLHSFDAWRCDVVGDRLIWMPPANPWSSRLAARLMVHLARAIDERQLAVEYFGSDAGFQLDPDPPPYGRIVSPDASLIRSARLTPTAAPPLGFWPLVPDLAIEIRSPSDRPAVWRAKLDAYADIAGGVLWAIDPQPPSGTVEIWRDGRPRPLRTLHSPTDVLQLHELLPDWSLTLAELWELGG